MHEIRASTVRPPYRPIVGNSSWARELQETIQRIAPHNSSVLVTGPSGTGKELIARAIHDQSRRSDAPFIPVDCASLTGSLLASQLFGHVAGAFTGASANALGCFRATDNGTIFLDEIGELDVDIQSKLLRVLQERHVIPVGSHESLPINVRVVAATNRDLKQDVVAGRFREDLYYRLSVVAVETKRLADRREDIIELAQHFLNELADHDGLPHCFLSPGAEKLLLSFSWPGNVRQLRNIMEQAVVLSDEAMLNLNFMQAILDKAALPGLDADRHDDLGRGGQETDSAADNWRDGVVKTVDDQPISVHYKHPEENKTSDNWLSLGDMEHAYICQTLERTYYNQSAAARLLGISRQALIRKIKRYKIDGRGGRTRN